MNGKFWQILLQQRYSETTKNKTEDRETERRDTRVMKRTGLGQDPVAALVKLLIP
jgi:hypothetical protein